MNVCKKLTLIGHLPFARTGSAELCAVSGKTDPALEQITQYGYKELSLWHIILMQTGWSWAHQFQQMVSALWLQVVSNFDEQ